MMRLQHTRDDNFGIKMQSWFISIALYVVLKWFSCLVFFVLKYIMLEVGLYFFGETIAQLGCQVDVK